MLIRPSFNRIFSTIGFIKLILYYEEIRFLSTFISIEITRIPEFIIGVSTLISIISLCFQQKEQGT